MAWGGASVDSVSIAYTHRRLAAYYEHNFGESIPAPCVSSSYFSPYRFYSTSVDAQTNPTSQQVTTYLSFELTTTACQDSIPGSCCTANLDQLVIRTGG